MKITLIYPGIAQIGFNSFGQGTPTTNLMSLGLAYIGASIKKSTPWEVDLIDLRKMSGWDMVATEIKDRASDVVGIYVNTVNYDFAMICAETAHTMGKVVLAGGPHATLSPQELLDTGFVDHVIVGEAEYTITEILNSLSRGSEVSRLVQGTHVSDLDQLPFPDRDLFDLEGRLASCHGIFPFPHRYAGIIGSRGCYYNCAFCQPLERKIFGKKVRFRSVENMIREVCYLKEKYNINFVMFQDDLLTQWKEWAMDLCAEMKKVGLDWGGLSRVDTLDEDIVRAMSDSGCKVLQFGFESGSQRILNMLRKGTKVDQAVTAAKLCRQYGILIFANYIMGIPTETRQDLEETYTLMEKIRPEIQAANYFSPIPGSSLYEYCRDNNLISATSYDMFVRGAVSNKIEGIDYAQLGRYKNKIERLAPAWYSEGYYATHVMKRWLGLFKHGFVLSPIKELVSHTPFLYAPIKAMRLRTQGGETL